MNRSKRSCAQRAGNTADLPNLQCCQPRCRGFPIQVQPQMPSLGPTLDRLIFWICHNEGVRLDGSNFSLVVAAKSHWTAMLTNFRVRSFWGQTATSRGGAPLAQQRTSSRIVSREGARGPERKCELPDRMPTTPYSAAVRSSLFATSLVANAARWTSAHLVRKTTYAPPISAILGSPCLPTTKPSRNVVGLRRRQNDLERRARACRRPLHLSP